MKTVAFIAALAGFAAAAPQAVTSAITPDEETPQGCKADFDGKFQVVVEALASKKRSIQKRQSTPLEIELKGGVMTDAQGRTGYIASNNQFQFDGPAQAGAIYTAGWSVCSNGSIALGNSAIFYQCLSGTFYNLYDENTAEQCSPVYIHALGASTATGVAQLADGQPTAASAQPDGQVTAGAAQTILCQIGDGQIQQNTCMTTATPIAEATDGQISAPKATITQIGDGQIQAPAQQAASSPTAAVVSQIGDGQIQAPTATAPVVTQIGDGQIQAPTGAVVSQISDGQIQVPTNGTTVTTARPTTPNQAAASSPSAFTGAAAAPTFRAELFGLAAGVIALAAL